MKEISISTFCDGWGEECRESDVPGERVPAEQEVQVFGLVIDLCDECHDGYSMARWHVERVGAPPTKAEKSEVVKGDRVLCPVPGCPTVLKNRKGLSAHCLNAHGGGLRALAAEGVIPREFLQA